MVSVAVLTGYAEKAGRETRRLARVAGRYSLEREARRLMGQLQPPQAGQLRVPPDKAWASFDGTKLDGLGKALARVRELGEQWAADRSRWEGQRNMPYDLPRTEDLLANPELMDIALHDDLLRAAADYLGQVPRLHTLTVWWSPANNTLRSSQLFHYDHRDSLQAKIFINLTDVTAATGPLHFLGADQSAHFNAKIGYTQQKISDEKIYSVFNQSDLHTTIGPAGAGVIVDTARCLHYGSRGNSEGRLMFMINYARVNCVDPGKGDPVLDPVRHEIARTRYANDPVRTFVLTAPGGSTFSPRRLGLRVVRKVRSVLGGG